MKKIGKNSESFVNNVNLAKAIKNNINYLSEKFKELKNLDPYTNSEDTSILNFVSCYFASKGVKLNDQQLIISVNGENQEMFVFETDKLYRFTIADKVKVECIKNYEIKSSTLIYKNIQDSIFILKNGNYGFSNSNFDNISSNAFDNTINPEVESVELDLGFKTLNASSKESNLSIETIISKWTL
ncbi:hypothetical protein ACWEXW_09265 [Staphylococcus xylosus]|uniref:hypothetical protein n=2 Tax=Staphylococcus xylosus TaxID=1288 RepID=UPI001187AF6F|nr:hypothetical protein [Staphylococcus xylosus]QDW89743.1 hypothetical protein DWB98_09970 [Staphylococcus xylosus]